MIDQNDRGEALARFSEAVGNIARELLGAGVPADPLAAALRIEAGAIEAKAPRAGGMNADERELVDLARKGHEFVNALQIAGVDEKTAVSVLTNVAIERVARTSGAAHAAHWLRRLAAMVDANGDAIEAAAQAH